MDYPVFIVWTFRQHFIGLHSPLNFYQITAWNNIWTTFKGGHPVNISMNFGSNWISGLSRPLVKSAYQKIFFLFLNQNICCGYSKEPSQWDGSFEHPKHVLKLMGKKIFKRAAVFHKILKQIVAYLHIIMMDIQGWRKLILSILFSGEYKKIKCYFWLKKVSNIELSILVILSAIR